MSTAEASTPEELLSIIEPQPVSAEAIEKKVDASNTGRNASVKYLSGAFGAAMVAAVAGVYAHSGLRSNDSDSDVSHDSHAAKVVAPEMHKPVTAESEADKKLRFASLTREADQALLLLSIYKGQDGSEQKAAACLETLRKWKEEADRRQEGPRGMQYDGLVLSQSSEEAAKEDFYKRVAASIEAQ